MKIVLAADEKNKITDKITQYLKGRDHQLVFVGALVKPNEKWVEIGKEAAKLVADRKVDEGILLCWSGTGITMAANRFKKVRAALCWNPDIAKASRKWDNANVLCLAYGFLKEDKVEEILDAWFSEKFDEEGLNEAHKLEIDLLK